MNPLINITDVEGNRTSLEYCNELNYSRMAVDDYKEFKSIVIAGEDGVIEIPYGNIPTLITMLQSVNIWV